MQYFGLAVFVALLALAALILALRILGGRRWLRGWLRGTSGLLVLAFAVVVGLIAWDFSSYRSVPDGQPLTTLSFHADGEQRYQVRLQRGNDTQLLFLEGDLWQLDVRVLRWEGLAQLIGLQPGFRLETLSGRFLAVEQQDQASYPRVALAQSPVSVDFWRWLRMCECTSLFLEARPQQLTFIPIADGAAFEVDITAAGLVARAISPAAVSALAQW